MECCRSSSSAGDVVSKTIDDELRDEKAKSSLKVKLLLLGPSTFTPPPAYSDRENDILLNFNVIINF